MPLYRALRDVEVASGMILIPKSQAPFRAHPRIPNVIPFTLGERTEHAMREHQWEGQYPTRGVSCTTEWMVAVRYAMATKVIVRIAEDECTQLGIIRYRVRDHVPLALIEHPEDEEVILVSDKDGAFPHRIINAVFDLSENNGANHTTEPASPSRAGSS